MHIYNVQIIYSFFAWKSHDHKFSHIFLMLFSRFIHRLFAHSFSQRGSNRCVWMFFPAWTASLPRRASPSCLPSFLPNHRHSRLKRLQLTPGRVHRLKISTPRPSGHRRHGRWRSMNCSNSIWPIRQGMLVSFSSLLTVRYLPILWWFVWWTISNGNASIFVKHNLSHIQCRKLTFAALTSS